MNKFNLIAILGLIAFAALEAPLAAAHPVPPAPPAQPRLRSFYWTAQSQSYQYDSWSAREECYANAEAEAYPYAYNTCVAKIGSYACDYRSTTQVERLGFSGQPGLYECTVRVWVQAWEE